MKRGLTVYSRVQQRTKTILDMISFAGAAPTKPTALKRNYKGMRARLGDKWTPVCKAVLDVLKRNFMVVLIDEYLTSQMCHSCHNKMVPRKGAPREKYCNHCSCDVDRDVNAAKNMLEVFLFHVRGLGRPDYLCRPKQRACKLCQRICRRKPKSNCVFSCDFRLSAAVCACLAFYFSDIRCLYGVTCVVWFGVM
jgi:hypothetical protein